MDFHKPEKAFDIAVWWTVVVVVVVVVGGLSDLRHVECLVYIQVNAVIDEKLLN